MTDKKIKEIRERCEAATTGPWCIRRYTVEDYNSNQICGDFGFRTDDDKKFIAHARGDIPDLLDYIAVIKCEKEALEFSFKNREKAFVQALHENIVKCVVCIHDMSKCGRIPAKCDMWEFDEPRFLERKIKYENT